LYVNHKYGQCSLIFCANTIANIDYLDEIIESAYSLLHEDGVFVIETQYGLDVLQKCLLDTVYHEHLNYFTARSSARFFESKGFHVVSMERIINKGGSVRISLSKKKPIGRRFDLINLLELEEGIEAGAINFANSMLKAKNDFWEYITSNKIDKLLGFGASVGTSSIASFLEIESLLSCIYDDNPLVNEILLGGSSIPVVQPHNGGLSKLAHQHFYIFASRYADKILNKHPDLLANGNEAFFAIPNFKLLK
jgi:C-methyltransferase C-terminal domain